MLVYQRVVVEKNPRNPINLLNILDREDQVGQVMGFHCYVRHDPRVQNLPKSSSPQVKL